jgi:hypothetical protein
MSTSQQTTSPLALLGRIFWMMLGPMVLAILAFNIAKRGNGWFTGVDIAFLVILVGLLFARWLEFLGGSPQTSTGDPATPRHLRQYAVGALSLGLGVWVIANVLGNHWLHG